MSPEALDSGRRAWIRPALRVIPLAAAFGYPAAFIGLIAGLAVGWSTGLVVLGVLVGIALTITLTAAMAIAFSREAEAPRKVSRAALIVALLSASGCLVWLAATMDVNT